MRNSTVAHCNQLRAAVLRGRLACSYVLAGPGCWRTDSLPAEDPSRLTIQLRSPAFSDGAHDPQTFTCDGSDQSPPLEWSGVPASARSLVLICDDPDAPMGTWSHWVVFNLSPEIKGLKARNPDRGNDHRRRRQGTTGPQRLRQDRLRRTLPAERDAPVFLPALCSGYRSQA